MSQNSHHHIISLLVTLLFAIAGCQTTSIEGGSSVGTSDGKVPDLPASTRAEIPMIVGLENLNACPITTADLTQAMLTLINQARGQSRMCGQSHWNAVAPLSLNEKLSLAAARHSADMANNNFFSHEGSDGQKADGRTNDADYQWFSVAENIAGGQTEIAAVIQDWLDSEKHCVNIMRPELTEAGVGCFMREATDLKIYWTLVLARPLLE